MAMGDGILQQKDQKATTGVDLPRGVIVSSYRTLLSDTPCTSSNGDHSALFQKEEKKTFIFEIVKYLAYKAKTIYWHDHKQRMKN